MFKIVRTKEKMKRKIYDHILNHKRLNNSPQTLTF